MDRSSFEHRARIGLAGTQGAALHMSGNTRPPAGTRLRPVQSFDDPVDLSFFDENDFFPAPSPWVLGA